MAVSMRSSTVSPESSEPYSPTANEFPRQAGALIRLPRDGNGFLSPSPSSLSFDESRSTPISDLGEEKQILRKTGRGAPGDASLSTMVRREHENNSSLSRRKSQFYGEVFAYRESNISARNKIHQYSVITAEVKTNVIVQDESVFLADLSQHLSQRYHRPISSIFITLAHSVCLIYAGTFDSAYILTITALPSQIQPTTNKRNAALMQKYMAESLGVSQNRGIVRFVSVAEEDLATNGVTILGEIETLSKNSSEDGTADSHSKTSTTKGRSRKTQLKRTESPLREDSGQQSGEDVLSPLPSSKLMAPSIAPGPSLLDTKAQKVQRLGKKKSFLALFGK